MIMIFLPLLHVFISQQGSPVFPTPLQSLSQQIQSIKQL